jgi:hypothetical protein
MSMGWDYVSKLRPPTGRLFIPHVIYEYGEHGRMRVYWQGKTEEERGRPVPVPLSPSQIQHWLKRLRTQVSAVGGGRLSLWAMARPKIMTYFLTLAIAQRSKEVCI